MNFFNSKTKLFLDMSNAKLLVRSIVFIDDTLRIKTRAKSNPANPS